MRTVTRTINVYKFLELGPAARDKARNFIADEYPWIGEAKQAIDALCKKFDVVPEYELDYGDFTRSRFSGDFVRRSESWEILERIDDDELAQIMAGLGTFDAKTLKGHGDCKLTGSFVDELAIDGLRIAHSRGERLPVCLMEAAFASLMNGIQADWEDHQSDDSCAETAEANGWEFDMHGNLFR
jgi:hypothetical protein